MKDTEMHYFSDLFDKVLYMFRTSSLPIIRSISTLYTGNRYLSFYFCWLSASRQPTVNNVYMWIWRSEDHASWRTYVTKPTSSILTTLADSQQK